MEAPNSFGAFSAGTGTAVLLSWAADAVFSPRLAYMAASMSVCPKSSPT